LLPPTPTNSLRALDVNLRAQSGSSSADSLRWVDGSTLTVEGIGWPHESAAFCRFPDRSENELRGALWQLSRCSAGVCVRFLSNAQQLSARWKLRNENLAMPHMPATSVSGLDLYVRDPQENRLRWAAAARAEDFPFNTVCLLQEQPPQMREYFLYLPLYNGIEQLQIGVNSQAEISLAAPRETKSLCFYGASIVQGACASRSGLSLSALLGRRFERAVWNFGFSGNSHAEPEVARLLAELDPALYIIGPAPSLTAKFIATRLPHFLQLLRDARGSTPILLVENAIYQDAWTNPQRNIQPREANAALRIAFDNLKNRIDGLHFIAGENALGSDGEATVDGTHPNDIGFMRLAELLSIKLGPLLQSAQ
jgi:lysophospholipase L1-like esterase